MKMQFGVTFLVSVLLCLVCTCNGFPPGGQTSTGRAPFTEAEDNFIIEELSNILDGTILVYKREVWDKIQDKHKEKARAHIDGFLKERSADSLRSRFKKVLIHNHQHTAVKVPEILLRKIVRAQELKLQQGGHDKHRYTREENDFIIEELQKLVFTENRLFAELTVEAIRKAHDENRRAGIPGFQHARSYNSLRKQVYQLKLKDKLPQDLVEKFEMRQRDNAGASSSTSTAQNQQTDIQESIEVLDDAQEDNDIYAAILSNPLVHLDLSKDI